MNTTEGSRLTIRIDADKIIALPRRQAKTFKFGSVSVPYLQYKRGRYSYFALFYYDNGKRKRDTRATFAAAKSRAEEISHSIQAGEINMLGLKENDRASYLRALELIEPTKKSLELVCSEYAEAAKILDGVSILEAARSWRAQHPAGFKTKTIPQIVEEYLFLSEIGPKWRRVLSKMLARFTESFTGLPGELQANQIQEWLNNLTDKKGKRLGPISRKHYRSSVQSILKFAKDREYLTGDRNVLNGVKDPKVPAMEVNIYTPEELVTLLHVAEQTKSGRKMIPFIAITAFAGVRHGEMNEEKIRLLDWSDIDFEQKMIHVSKGSAKTGAGREVDMPDNLIAWISPYARPHGKVVKPENTSNALCRLRKKAGITGNKRNALRKSFISYSKARSRNIEAVADQAGNSAAVIKKHYLHSDTKMKADAVRWFSIMPSRADTDPLFAWAKSKY